MEGVRRWISSNPTVNVRKSHGKSVVKTEVEKTTIGPEWDPQSTEAIALQLLNPIVSEEEEAEYQGCVHVIRLCISISHLQGDNSYIDQCQDLLDAPILAEKKDLDLYHAAVRTAMGEIPDGKNDAADDVFAAYVERGTIQFLDGRGRRDNLIVPFNYERWVAAGHRG
jgi:hypothetical protein